jgi:hypothetical protein
MAGLADIAGIDMRWAFRCGCAAAMATKAVIHDTRVTEGDTDQPAIGHMANITLLGGRNMRCTLTGCDDVVVTAIAHAVDFSMIHRHYWGPARSRVTSFTHIRGSDVAAR